MRKDFGFDSLCVQDPPENRTTQPRQIPIYATSVYDFPTIEEGISVFTGAQPGHIYARFGNPNTDAVTEKIASLETCGMEDEACGILVSSGMAAISTLVLSLLRPGEKILTQGNLYGGTTNLFQDVIEPLGMPVVLTDLRQYEQVEALLRQDTSIRLIFLETPSNPTLDCVDLAELAALARRHGCRTVVDNTFSTPFNQQPFLFGVDYIIHSTTKYLNGHGNSVAGIILSRDLEFMQERVFKVMKLTGTNSNAFDAWMLNNGLKTLGLRMERHNANAIRVAHFLESHPQVARVNYLGLLSHPDHQLANRQMKGYGGMLSFELKGGLDAGKRFMNRIEFCTLAPTLGDVETLVLHPASMSHIGVPRELREANGITDGLVRISVGIEQVEDILRDLEQALEE